MNTIGEALRIERKKANITLEEISKKTNIGIKSLMALEENEFKQIPGDFYLRNYIKTYLKAVGCDENVFMGTFRASIDTVLSNSPERSNAYYSKLRYTRFKSRNLVLSFGLFGLLVIVTIILLYISRDNIIRDKNPVKKKEAVKQEKIVVPQLASIAPTLPVPVQEINYDYDYWPVVVNVEFTDNCWFQAKRGYRKVIEQVFKSGDKISLKGYNLKIIIGSPSAVKFFVNNHEVSYLKTLTTAEQVVISPETVNDLVTR